MNVEQKIKIFEDSCRKLLSRESADINQKIDIDIEKQIKDELDEYEKKEEFAYNKKMEKLEKDYNKELYNLELESKKEILKQKKIVQIDLKNEVVDILKKFIDSSDYKEFLENRIKESISKLDNTQNTVLFLVPNDFEKYKEEFSQNYKIEIKEMEERFIGGCIIEDRIQGIYVDNTLQANLEENLEL